MNEELTNEVLECISTCDGDCRLCPAKNFCNNKILAAALLEERAKPKYDVWKNAPPWATSARVRWSNPNYPVGKDELYSETYTREPPKTRARIMAEEVATLVNKATDRISVKEIEAVLNKYAGELEGKK